MSVGELFYHGSPPKVRTNPITVSLQANQFKDQTHTTTDANQMACKDFTTSADFLCLQAFFALQAMLLIFS